ncbi:MAG: ABC transporter permease [Eubacteriales bacterium]|nr:ABC transporter permease [Eubacteriales bacterium]
MKREITVQSRGFGLPLMVSGINMILFLAALVGTFGIITRMKLGTQSDYGAFLLIYAAVAFLVFILLLFVTPAMTAGSISMERSMQTLDLMLTTQLSPFHIITGKLCASAWTICVLLVSAIPAMLLPLLYGGISVPEVAVMLFVFAAEAIVLLCIGMYASALSAHTARATAMAYAFVFAVCIGLPVLCLLISPFVEEGNNYTAYLLLLDPLVCVGSLIARQTGRDAVLTNIFAYLSLEPEGAFIRYFVPLSLASQLTGSVFLVMLSVVRITPKRKIFAERHL